LENHIRKLLIFRDPDALAWDLQAKARRKSLVGAPPGESHPRPVEPSKSEAPILEKVVQIQQQGETDAILAALHSTRWNRKRAAAVLKIAYKALLYKMKKLGIEYNRVSSNSATARE
jgi:DNA-binding NtrC family response regulator